MSSLSSLTESLFSQISEHRADASLIELDERDSPTGTTLAFQYFPETISSSKQVNRQQKEIPGASLPLYQWVSSGEHLISFSAVFSTDVDYLSAGSGGSNAILSTLRAQGLTRRNVDIRSAIVWLRSGILPTYGENAQIGVPLTLPPRKFILHLPNTGLGLWGGDAGGSIDGLRCEMTQCDFEIHAFFPSGLPRLATFQLSFAQTAQFRGSVQFPSATEGYRNAIRTFGEPFVGYNITPRRAPA